MNKDSNHRQHAVQVPLSKPHACPVINQVDREIDTAERFLAALLRAVCGCTETPTPDEVQNVAVDAMPTGEHRAVFRAILGFAEIARRPTVDELRRLASMCGYCPIEKLLNPNNDDLIARLPWIETTAAGLGNYARAVNELHRKRQQVLRIWRRVPMPESPTKTTPVKTAPWRTNDVRINVA